MIKKPAILVSAVLSIFLGSLQAQYTPWVYWTLLPEDQMAVIIAEASGETAWHTIMETGGYPKDRWEKEYNTTFYEAQYILEQLQHYGLQEARIVRYPREEKTWDGIRGDLWEVSPRIQKIISFNDLTMSLASGSENTDAKGELVWCGGGSSEDFEAAGDLQGKIVVIEGSTRVFDQAKEKGALGIVAISTTVDPIAIPSSRVSGGFGFSIPWRTGRLLKQRLRDGEKIIAHARVETALRNYELQDVTCKIQGKTDENAVIFSAHIFEGLTKQGANDNKSGGAGILEVARILNRLIQDGKLPKPRRSILFLWGPEFSGTGPWVKDHKEEMARTLCNINMDMVGEWLTKTKSVTGLVRTTFGNPHYINDVMENYYRFVGEGNRERIQNRGTGQRIPHPIISATGADEPFYYSIETHSGGSDHEVFNNWGVQVPGVQILVWPDPWYHLSRDNVDNADPTQMRRVAVIGAAAAFTVANADDDMAIKIAGETTSNAMRRLGHQVVIAMERLNRATGSDLGEAYKDALSLIEVHVTNEKNTLDTIMELASDEARIGHYITKMQASIDALGKTAMATIEEHMMVRADSLKTVPAEIELTDLEKKAAEIFPKQTEKVLANGYNGYRDLIDQVPEEQKEKYPYPTERGQRIDTAEIGRLCNGENNVFTVKKMLDAQSPRKTDLQHILNYLKILEMAGLVTM